MPKTQQTPAQQKTVSRVMHEFSHGELETRTGEKVDNRKQAVAIALSEAGASRDQAPPERKKRQAHTRAKEANGQTALAEKEGKAAQKRVMKKAAPKTSPSSARGKSARAGAGKAAATRASGGPSRDDLYEEAKKHGIPGRSAMSKAELERALRAH